MHGIYLAFLLSCMYRLLSAEHLGLPPRDPLRLRRVAPPRPRPERPVVLRSHLEDKRDRHHRPEAADRRRSQREAKEEDQAGLLSPGEFGDLRCSIRRRVPSVRS